MKTYSCIIIEDEPIAAEIISDYISELSFLKLVGVHHDAISAISYLNSNRVDLIFLDIHLPKIKGLDFLKSLKNPPNVIITTAYEEYALKGYEYNVLDYLLKPIEFSRFLQAVNKMVEKPKIEQVNDAVTNDPYINLNVSKKLIRINLSELLFIESDKENIHLHTNEKIIVCKMQIGEIEKQLNSHQFLRIHRSFIVALDKVDSMALTEFEIKNHTIPVGRNYREHVRKYLNR